MLCMSYPLRLIYDDMKSSRLEWEDIVAKIAIMSKITIFV